MQGHEGFCAECFAQARFIVQPACRHCGAPLSAKGLANADGHCAPCEQQAPLWDAAQAALVYNEWTKRLILPLKYADRTENARILAREMFRVGEGMIRSAAFLVPVPLYRKKLWSRRYNQAALIAWHLSKLSGVPVLPMALRRLRSTRPLARLGSQERFREISGSIGVNPQYLSKLRGNPVVVIDDVLTTGATASACSQALREAGVERVELLVAARAGNMEEDRQNETRALRDYA
ncbi:ComF family protein [Neokomagataea tanensis]|uniref:ComF family protein n=1 Tax=Neokomagataea tanensis TaxID=661191 RepID=A0A4Y6V6M3_9PROT|nr:ComF family protein [Neokomagataea tanensis]QDH25719.1 ComF family protein [Neokomagataea tanensis]